MAAAVVGGVVARQVTRFLRLAGLRDVRRELAGLQELVTAWQGANGDEVRDMHQRVTDAHVAMSAAERSARVTANHLTAVEDTPPRL